MTPLSVATGRVCCLVGLLLNGCSIAAEPADGPPSILVLLADDLGARDAGFAGGRFDTPNLDGLADESVVFTRAYSVSATCSPARAAILTGQHPARLQMTRHIPAGMRQYFDALGRTTEPFHVLASDPSRTPSRNWLPLETVTLAEALAPEYHTGYFGKWHLGHEPYHPRHQDFDDQFGVGNLVPRSYYPPYWRKEVNPYRETPPDVYLTDRLADDVVAYLDRQKLGVPFFAFVSFYAPHSPHVGRKDLLAKQRERGFKGKEAHYGAMVEGLDEAVGRILATLENNGLEQNTVVFFLSDQGSQFSNAPFRGGKNESPLYEGGCRVPMLVRWPGVVKPSKCEVPVVSTDIFPSIVEIAKTAEDRDRPVDGASLVPLLKGGNALDREYLYLERRYSDQYAAVVSSDWKLIVSHAGNHELYHLADDPYEGNDFSERMPAKVAEMLRSYERWRAALSEAP